MNQHNTFLLTWNPGKTDWDELPQDAEAVYMGFRPRLGWSCGNTKRIAAGDRVFMMRLGWREQVTGIFASGWITGEPLEDEHWSDERPGATALYIEFEPDVLLNPDVDELFDPDTLRTGYNWHPQRSGVTIPQDVAERLEQAWQQHLQYSGAKVGLPGEQRAEDAKGQLYKEGTKSRFSGYRYERDPRARDACIRHYGASCAVCGFDFGAVYGEIGEGFIHVHHLLPLSKREEKYEVDPVEDLRPVCPNCHAMLHRESPPMKISELRKRMGLED